MLCLAAPLALGFLALAAAPAQAEHIQWSIRSGAVPARSVNLGGWLVAEYWMTQGSPAWDGVPNEVALQGEYAAMKYLNRSKGIENFENHRSTWITEQDIRDIAAANLTAVRVPVGFWIVGDSGTGIANSEQGRMYAPGALKYLDALINDWAVANNIAVMLSLHAHQGSQNGNDNSAPPVFGVASWSSSQANVDNSVLFATFLADRYKSSDAFLGLNMMNEPNGATDINVVTAYYQRVYQAVRAKGNNCILGVSPMLGQQTPEFMQDFMRPPSYANMWHEFHPYFIWGHELETEAQIIVDAQAYGPATTDQWHGNPLFIGEWSLGTQSKAPFKDLGQRKQYAQAQLDSYRDAKGGWSFWSWRHSDDANGNYTGWSLRAAIRDNVINLRSDNTIVAFTSLTAGSSMGSLALASATNDYAASALNASMFMNGSTITVSSLNSTNSFNDSSNSTSPTPKLTHATPTPLYSDASSGSDDTKGTAAPSPSTTSEWDTPIESSSDGGSSSGSGTSATLAKDSSASQRSGTVQWVTAVFLSALLWWLL